MKPFARRAYFDDNFSKKLSYKNLLIALFILLLAIMVFATAPTQSEPSITSSDPSTNNTFTDLIVSNQSTADADGDIVYNAVRWYVNNVTNISMVHPDDDGLVLFMPMYGNSTEDVVDYSGNGNNGSFYGNVTYTTDSLFTSGFYQFNSDYQSYINLSRPDNLLLDTVQNFTILAWFNTQDLLGDQAIITRYKRGTLGDWSLRTNGSNVICSREIAPWDLTGVTTLQANTWYQVACTYNGTGVVIYLNGMNDTAFTVWGNVTGDKSSTEVFIGAEGTATVPSKFFNGSIGSIAIYNRSLSSDEILGIYKASKYGNFTLSDTDTSIGDFWRAEVGAYDYSSGDLQNTSELEIVNNAPTQTQPSIISSNPLTNDTYTDLFVQNQSTADSEGDVVINRIRWYLNNVTNISMARPDDNGVILYLPFDGNTTNDYSSSAIVGTNTLADFYEGGIWDGYMNFSGDANAGDSNNNKKSISLGTAAQFSGGNFSDTAFTVMAWILMNGSSDNESYIISNENYNSGCAGGYTSGCGGLGFYAKSASSSRLQLVVVSDNQTLSTGPQTCAYLVDSGDFDFVDGWVLVGVSHSGIRGEGPTFYYNGQAYVSSSNTSCSDWESGLQSWASPLPANQFLVGQNQHGGSGFEGAIDELVMYNRQLSSDEVYNFYQASKYGNFTLDNVITKPGDFWSAEVTPFDYVSSGIPLNTSELEILSGGCATPFVGISVGENTDFCAGEYYFNNSNVINILSDGIVLNFTGAYFEGGDPKTSPSSPSRFISLTNNNITIAGLNTTGYGYAVLTDSVDGFTFQNGWINSYYDGWILLSNTTNAVVDDSDFGFVNNVLTVAGGVYTRDSTLANFTIQNSRLSNCTRSCIAISNMTGENITIQNNYLGGSTSKLIVVYKSSNNINIVNNTLNNSNSNYDNYNVGIHILTSYPIPITSFINVDANKFYNIGCAGILTQGVDNLNVTHNEFNYDATQSQNAGANCAFEAPTAIDLASNWKDWTSDSTESVYDNITKLLYYSPTNTFISGNTFNGFPVLLRTSQPENLTHDLTNYWFRSFSTPDYLMPRQDYYISNSVNNLTTTFNETNTNLNATYDNPVVFSDILGVRYPGYETQTPWMQFKVYDSYLYFENMNYSEGWGGYYDPYLGVYTTAIYNLSSALAFIGNGSVPCTDIINCDDNLNFTLEPFDNLTVLDDYNITEGIVRENDPVSVLAVSSFEKKITNNLTDKISVLSTFNFPCGQLVDKKLVYSNGIDSALEWVPTHYACSNDLVSLNLNIAPGSNNILSVVSVSTPNDDTGNPGGGTPPGGNVSNGTLPPENLPAGNIALNPVDKVINTVKPYFDVTKYRIIFILIAVVIFFATFDYKKKMPKKTSFLALIPLVYAFNDYILDFFNSVGIKDFNSVIDYFANASTKELIGIGIIAVGVSTVMVLGIRALRKRKKKMRL